MGISWKDFNPELTNQPDDYIDSAAGAIAQTPIRVGKIVGKPTEALREDWRPSAGVRGSCRVLSRPRQQREAAHVRYQSDPRQCLHRERVTTVFNFTFKVLDSSDLKVQVDGQDKIIGAEYTVSGVGNPGWWKRHFHVGAGQRRQRCCLS